MFTLDNFYTSDEWRNLLTIIKSERLNDRGELICVHCERPIVRKYDCIGHHITELTEDNVNDYEISLNPENVALVHHKCHNIIHNKLGYGGKRIYLVYGSPLAGKNTFIKENAEPDDLIVDMDNIWECISNGKRYEKPNRLKGVAFQVRDALIDMVRVRNGKWLNAWIVGGYPMRNERERLCKTLKAREIYIDTPKEECIKRLYENPDGRNVEEWHGYIEDWWAKYF